MKSIIAVLFTAFLAVSGSASAQTIPGNSYISDFGVLPDNSGVEASQSFGYAPYGGCCTGGYAFNTPHVPITGGQSYDVRFDYSLSVSDLTKADAGFYAYLVFFGQDAHDDDIVPWVDLGHILSGGSESILKSVIAPLEAKSAIIYGFLGVQTLFDGSYPVFDPPPGTVTVSAVFKNASIAPTAVPGPEAGVGLAALAVGGLAFYLKRRRSGVDALFSPIASRYR